MASFVFVNRFYWPEEPATAQLLADLSENLADRGHEVRVVTSRPAGAPHSEARRGVRISRLAGCRLGRFHVLLRLADFVVFHLLAWLHLVFTLRPGDLLVSLSDPPMLGFTLWFAAKARRARLIHYAQDVYPEIAMRLSPHPAVASALGLLRPLRDFAWRHSEGCVVLGSDMRDLVLSRSVPAERIHVVPNWAPAGLAPASADEISACRTAWGLSDAFVVMYSGNIGRVHDLEPVIAIAHRLRTEPGVVFLFVGGGAGRAALEAEVRRLSLQNVRFSAPAPRDRLSASLSAGDVHLVTVREGCQSAVFPSKLYGVTAVARPILFVGPPNSEIARIVAQWPLGMAFTRTQISEAADAILSLRQDPSHRQQLNRAASAFHESGGVTRAADAWESLARRKL